MKIAVTGSIGSGKSSVSKIIRDYGFDVFDCDAYNSFLLKEDFDVINEIKKEFDLTNEDILKRKKLAEIVFNDSVKLVKINKILHPRIINKMLDESHKSEIFFAEVPLLFELKLEKNFDYVICVVSNYDLRIKRLVEKGYLKDDVIKRMNYQLPQKYKMSNSDFVIYNNNDFKELKEDVESILKILGL